MTNSEFFFKGGLPVFSSDTSNLISGEYFLDGNDPGFGNATSIQIIPASQDAHISFSLSIDTHSRF